MRLGHVLHVELAVAAGIAVGLGLPGGTAGGELFIRDEHVNRPPLEVQADEVTGFDQGQRAAHGGFRRHVQHAGAVAGAAHAGIAHAHHVAHAFFEQLLRHRQHAPLRHAGSAHGPGAAQHQDGVLGHIKIGIVEALLEVVVIIEHKRRAGVLEQGRIHDRRVFDHGAARGQVAMQHGGAAIAGDGGGRGADHVGIEVLRVGNVLAQGLAIDGEGLRVQQLAHAVEQGAKAAGGVEIIHQVLAAGAKIGEQRGALRELVETLQRQLDAQATGHGDEVHDGVGAATQGHVHLDRVVKGVGGDHIARLEVVPHVLHGLAAGGGGHAAVGRIHGRNGGRAGQGHAHDFRQRRHRAGRAHGHAMAGGASDAVLDLAPGFIAQIARALLVPVLPHIAAGAQRLAMPEAANHGPARHVDAGQVHAEGPHQERRGGLVTAAEKHRAVQRIGAQQLLHLHGKEVAVEHCRGLRVHFASGHHRHFHGQAACLEHAALHRLRRQAQVHVAGVQVRPRVEDADDRLALVIVLIQSRLFGARPVAERAQFGPAKPAPGTEFLWCLASAHAPAP